MSRTTAYEAMQYGLLKSAMTFGWAAVAITLGIISPAQAKEREAAAIPCPRTLVSPDAQKRIDAGEKPEIIMSRYKPGLVNPQGFCTVTLSPYGAKMFQTYNEATSVGQIPIRFEYNYLGLYGYAGEKGMPLGKGNADIVCYAPAQDEFAVDCTISLTSDGTIFFRRKEGRGIDESSVRIASEQIFKPDLKTPQSMIHYKLVNSGSIEDATYRQMYEISPTDCSKPYWKNLAKVVKLSTGRRNGNATDLSKSFLITDADPNIFVRPGDTPQMFPRFELKNGGAIAIISSVLTSEVVQLDVETACEGKLSKAFLTELPRVMAHVYDAIKLRMLKQQ